MTQAARQRDVARDQTDPDRYPALAFWRESHHRGLSFAVDDPIARAARYEANTEELDRLARSARASREARVWQKAAEEELATAVKILADAHREFTQAPRAHRPSD
jgi:hypothetical protein